MTASPGGSGDGRGSVSPALAVVFATATVLALIIGGTGVMSLVTGHDPIVIASFGQLPGVIGPGFATLSFAGVLWQAVRHGRARYGAAFGVMLAAFAGYLIGVGVAGLAVTADLVLTLAALGRLVTDGFALLVAACALVCAWGGIALSRTHGSRPRWPWEGEDEP